MPKEQIRLQCETKALPDKVRPIKPFQSSWPDGTLYGSALVRAQRSIGIASATSKGLIASDQRA